MSRENQRLVTHEPVEFEKYAVDLPDFGRITHHLRGIYSNIYLQRMKANPEDVQKECNRLDLESAASWPTMPKNFPGTAQYHAWKNSNKKRKKKRYQYSIGYHTYFFCSMRKTKEILTRDIDVLVTLFKTT